MDAKQYMLTPLVEDRVVLLDGPDPLGSLEAEQFLEKHGFELLVSIRDDVNYSSSWAFRSDDPSCRFRGHIRCFSCYRDPDERGLLKSKEQMASSSHEITKTDLMMFNEYCLYELVHGRMVPIWFQTQYLKETVVPRIQAFFSSDSDRLETLLPKLKGGQRQRVLAALQTDPGCLPDLMVHGSAADDACKIVESGAILSSCRLHGVAGEALVDDERNFVADPADYFEYVMLGGVPMTDWVVYQRVVDRSPSDPENPLTWQEFSDNFLPAVNFVFRTVDLVGHPSFCCDGFHAVKIKDQLELDPYLAAVIVPIGLPESGRLLELLEARGLSGKVISGEFSGYTPERWAERMQQMVQRKFREAEHSAEH